MDTMSASEKNEDTISFCPSDVTQSASVPVRAVNTAQDTRESQQMKYAACVWDGDSEESITSYLLQEIDFLSLTSLDKDELQVQRMPTTVASQEIGIKTTTDNKNSHQDRSGGHHEEAGRVSTPINSEDHAFAFSSSYINTPPKDISLPDDFDFLTYSDSLESNLNHDHHPAWSEEGRVNEPRRPKNGFIRFSIKFRSEVAKKHPKLDNREISKMLGFRWRRMSAEEKKPYEEEFAKDIRRIRDNNPTWRYAPAKRSIEELVEPMPNRLRPREKLKRKSKDWVFTSETCTEHSGRGSSIQMDATTWVQCDLCNHWRPLSGHIEMEDLPEKWYCYMNPDTRFNVCNPGVFMAEQCDRTKSHLPSLFHMYPHHQPAFSSCNMSCTSQQQ
ncbi:hypothetical protein C0Q70_19225 [Pomacea canaliculata]|uniref:Sex-determining region Y protein n=1 Tax=Pomacea canaliculata TaxID=400727 RepID=A0A2T7NIQ8_POMCA|nr:hypothetical protein C0Q70_19225 [Pomacea canaliculata]